jgi:hypothetical protein
MIDEIKKMIDEDPLLKLMVIARRLKVMPEQVAEAVHDCRDLSIVNTIKTPSGDVEIGIEAWYVRRANFFGKRKPIRIPATECGCHEALLRELIAAYESPIEFKASVVREGPVEHKSYAITFRWAYGRKKMESDIPAKFCPWCGAKLSGTEDGSWYTS